ncbi:uncharacterized protein [Haliotis cracherodii]|uniref:uncharacterized protein n=1 Tax=Haliotis cracherodii TaxID=6455 RepID=UPI0039EA0EDA
MPRHIPSFLLLIDTIARLIYTSSSQTVIAEYAMRQNSFSNRLLSRFLISSSTQGSKVMCLLHCLRDERCVSFTFKKANSGCRIHGVCFSKPSDAPLSSGTELFYLSRAIGYIGYPCGSNADCKTPTSTCNAGVCDCEIGYSFSVNDRGCVRHCSRYGTDFTAYIERGLRDTNTFRDWGYSEEACLGLCTSESGYLCLTVERYPADGFCTLTHATWFDVAATDRDTAAYGYVMYHRNCAL